MANSDKNIISRNNDIVAAVSSTLAGRGLTIIESLLPTQLSELFSEQSVHRSHRDGVSCITFSSSGEYFATSSWDNTVYLWDMNQNSVIRVLSGHRGKVRKVAFTSEDLIITAGEDRTIHIWDCLGNLVYSIFDKMVIGISTTGRSILYSNEQKYGLDIIDITGELAPRIFPKQLFNVTTAEMCDDCNCIAVGCMDGSIQFWDLQENTIHTLPGHDKDVWHLSIDPGHGKILSAGADNMVKLTDKHNLTLAQTFVGHHKSAYCAEYISGTNLVISGSADKTLRVWDSQNGRLIHTHSMNSEVMSLKYNSQANTLVIGSRNGEVNIWKLNNRK